MLVEVFVLTEGRAGPLETLILAARADAGIGVGAATTGVDVDGAGTELQPEHTIVLDRIPELTLVPVTEPDCF